MMRDRVVRVVRVCFFSILTLFGPVLWVAAVDQAQYARHVSGYAGAPWVLAGLFALLAFWGIVAGPMCLPRGWFFVVAAESMLFGIISWNPRIGELPPMPLITLFCLVHSLWASYIVCRSKASP